MILSFENNTTIWRKLMHFEWMFHKNEHDFYWIRGNESNILNQANANQKY